MRSSSGRKIAVGSVGPTGMKRGTLFGTFTRAKCDWPPAGSRTITARFSESPLMYGNGWAGSTASGVSTGKTWSRKYSRSRRASSSTRSSQCTIRIPASSSRGVMSLRNVSACRWTRSCVRCGDQLQLLPDGEPVGGADGQAGALPALEAGDADHVELVEVAREDRQELDALQERERLVLGQFEHPGVEVQPGQLAVEEAIGRQPRGPGRDLGGHGFIVPHEGERSWLLVRGPTPRSSAARRSASVSTSCTRPGQSPRSSTAPSARCAAADPGPNAGRRPVPAAVSSVVPVPCASATNARSARPAAASAAASSSGRRAGRSEESAATAVPAALRAPCSSAGLSPLSGSSGTVRAPSRVTSAAAAGSSVTTRTVVDDGAGEGGGDRVGEQREDEVGVRGRLPEPGRQRTQPGLGERQPLRRDHHRPRVHRPM